jgi:hypothetical protein
MGMFDYYEPTPPIECPNRGESPSGWQGKEGPCALVISEVHPMRRSQPISLEARAGTSYRIAGRLIVWAATAAVLVPLAAQADLFVGGGGGVFVPWQGNAGASAMGQLLFGTGSDHFRFGFEYEYRDYDEDGERFDADGPDYRVNVFSLLGEYHPLPELRFSPYVGFGASYVDLKFTARNQFNGLKYSKDKPGWGIFGLLGVEARPWETSPFLLFVETRFSADFVVEKRESDDGPLEWGQVGGFSGRLGLRVRF